ncbi:hypothetical protein PG993_007484 [Apiospora rasikravindrae]|uniref:Infection structure specific protein n=1 Tax=Apiospora rasikravindrae TaxID=990691 RepID=A0ABR1SXN9_9PEZI
MHFSQTAILVASLLHTTVVTAQDCKRDDSAVTPAAAIVARQATPTDSGTTYLTGTAEPTECSSLQSSLLNAMPTPPMLLSSIVQSAVMPATTLTDICGVSVASTATSAWTAYNLIYYDFFSSRAVEIRSLATKCPGTALPAVATSKLDSVLAAYSTFSSTGCGRKEVVATGTANAAAAPWPRETGAMNMVVAAAMGVAGAVVAL